MCILHTSILLPLAGCCMLMGHADEKMSHFPPSKPLITCHCQKLERHVTKTGFALPCRLTTCAAPSVNHAVRSTVVGKRPGGRLQADQRRSYRLASDTVRMNRGECSGVLLELSAQAPCDTLPTSIKERLEARRRPTVTLDAIHARLQRAARKRQVLHL